MPYVDWKKYVEQKEKAKWERLNEVPIIEKPVSAYKKWTDSVTRTNYCISEADYQSCLSIIRNEVKGKKTADEILKMLCKEDESKETYYIDTFPYFPAKDRPAKDNVEKTRCTFREAARLYVLFAYIIYRSENRDVDKNLFRAEAYLDFINENRTEENAIVWDALECMLDKKSFESPIKVTLLKGGAYKIKKYYLENDEIKDIRGASSILTYVGEELIPGEIEKEYIKECIIYAGGGSVFFVLPQVEEKDSGLWRRMENHFHEYTMSVSNAFAQKDVLLKDLLGSYQETIHELDGEIEKRKGAKIFDSMAPTSAKYHNENQILKLGKEEIKLEATVLNSREGRAEKCSLCGVRNASYTLLVDENEKVCGSCLHKRFAGKNEKRRYMDEYKKLTNDSKAQINSLNDIGDDVAVVYGDGNNMGGIVNSVDSLYEIMYFSRTTAEAAKRATFKALHRIYGKEQRTLFEIIAVGGDDIFLFVAGKGSIQFAAELIELFNEEFRTLHITKDEGAKYAATLSVGVCIAGSRTPVRVTFKNAEDALREAKKLSRANNKNGTDSGSLGFVALDSFTGTDERKLTCTETGENVMLTLLPYSLETARDMLKLGEIISGDTKNSRSNLFKILQTVEGAGSVAEGMLIYLYDQARNSLRLEKKLSFNTVQGFQWAGGYYKKGSENEGIRYLPWRDILNICSYYRRDIYGQ
ncbi:hypothetical protein DFR58_11754 [Anaerobacterium chartisolvens]|uniref:GGDEF domain-containing protein n=1 Tax=Anaerobacterium chartisolvens TaxID=1297424 RepID=A0A369B1B8_9FIRM|nr:hypothetical protein [Anaerobacterium chartisolvens]RCX13514.1 hypothetical protein DFR58_11754 [Anaerobacterium chartisolvens]